MHKYYNICYCNKIKKPALRVALSNHSEVLIMKEQTFKEFLWESLVKYWDFDPDDLEDCEDKDDLYMMTDVEEADVESFFENYLEVCEKRGWTPVDDFLHV